MQPIREPGQQSGDIGVFADSTIIFSALAGLALQVGGIDLNATYLHADRPGCVVAAQRAKDWRREGRVAIEQRAGKWCVVGAVVGDHWIAEQWDSDAPPGRAQGWRVRIPLRQMQSAPAPTQSDWPLDVIDRQLGARIQIRHSLRALDDHHKASLLSLQKQAGLHAGATRDLRDGRLTTFAQGQILLSGKDPLLGSYSILIQR